MQPSNKRFICVTLINLTSCSLSEANESGKSGVSIGILSSSVFLLSPHESCYFQLDNVPFSLQDAASAQLWD